MSHSEQSINSSKGDLSSFSDLPVGKVHLSGDSNEYVIIGNKKYWRNELSQAFGGTLNPGLAVPSPYEFGNPAPLGLSCFALTTFVLSLYNAGAMGISTPNVVISLSVFYGGAIQFLCGCWELLIGNTFGGTALTSYGAFWLSYSCLFLKAFGISEAYEDELMMNNAIGFFLIGWAIFTFILVLVTMKSTVAFFSLFVFLDLTFILLAASELSGSTNTHKAGGVFGVITALIAWYNAFSGVANSKNSYFTAHSIPLTKSN